MRRLLLPLVLAVLVAAACRGGGTGPTPVIRQPPFWEGTVRYSVLRVGDASGVSWRWSIEGGPVTWIKEQDPELPPLPGAVSYIIQSGSLRVSYNGASGPCTQLGEATLVLKPRDGYLVLGQDGTYSGSVGADTDFIATQSCPNATGPVDVSADIVLNMRGQVTGTGRMQGTMPEFTMGLSTINGAWDFLPRE